VVALLVALPLYGEEVVVLYRLVAILCVVVIMEMVALAIVVHLELLQLDGEVSSRERVPVLVTTMVVVTVDGVQLGALGLDVKVRVGHNG